MVIDTTGAHLRGGVVGEGAARIMGAANSDEQRFSLAPTKIDHTSQITSD